MSPLPDPPRQVEKWLGSWILNFQTLLLQCWFVINYLESSLVIYFCRSCIIWPLFIMPWKCFLNCVRPETEDVRQLDYQHCMLQDVPPQVFAYERTLEELYLDSNRVSCPILWFGYLSLNTAQHCSNSLVRNLTHSSTCLQGKSL